MMRFKRFESEYYASFERLILDIAGFYPGKWSRKWFVPLIRATIIFFSIFLAEAMLHFIFRNRANLLEISRTGMLFLEYFGFIMKYMSLHHNCRNLLILEEILANDLLVKVSTEELQKINKLVKPLSLITKFYQSACMVTVMFIGILPLMGMQENGKKAYPLPCAFPFNPDSYYGYVYLGEMMSLSLGAWISSTIDNYFVKMLAIGASYYSILGDKIRSLNKGETQLNNMEIHDFLKECVIYQQTILNYMFILQTTFSTGICGQFLCSGVVICLTGFQMLTVVHIYSIECILIVSYFSAMIIQLTLYCWYGQSVMEKVIICLLLFIGTNEWSDDLSNACYDTNWYEMSVPNRKMIILIMEGSKKPTIIQAGGYFDLNIKCLMAILRSSYSYFAILRQVYNKSMATHAHT